MPHHKIVDEDNGKEYYVKIVDIPFMTIREFLELYCIAKDIKKPVHIENSLGEKLNDKIFEDGQHDD